MDEVNDGMMEVGKIAVLTYEQAAHLVSELTQKLCYAAEAPYGYKEFRTGKDFDPQTGEEVDKYATD